MKTRKWIVLASAAILIAAVSSGIAFAWFTSKTSAPVGVITAGSLNIDLSFDSRNLETDYSLYPQAAWDPAGELPPDVLKLDYKLDNQSGTPVLAKLNIADLLKNGKVTGAALTKDGYVRYNGTKPVLERKYGRNGTTPKGIMYDYDIKEEPDGAKKVKLENGDVYVYIPKNTDTIISLLIWIDGDNSGNEYQFAKIELDTLTARATQYREAALASIFNLSETQLLEVLAETGGIVFE